MRSLKEIMAFAAERNLSLPNAILSIDAEASGISVDEIRTMIKNGWLIWNALLGRPALIKKRDVWCLRREDCCANTRLWATRCAVSLSSGPAP